MAFPPEIPTRAISVGGAAVLESSTLLKLQVTITASKSLVWDATGFRYERMSVTDTSELGSELVITLPRTDVQGWKDAKTGDIIDVSAPGSYTHRYTAEVRFLDANNRPVAVSPVTLGPFVVPAGDGPLDLDKMVPASTVAGETVSVPDRWGKLVAEAQAAAQQAQAALVDSARFVADQIGTPGTPANTQLSATFASKAIEQTVNEGRLSEAQLSATIEFYAPVAAMLPDPARAFPQIALELPNINPSEQEGSIANPRYHLFKPDNTGPIVWHGPLDVKQNGTVSTTPLGVIPSYAATEAKVGFPGYPFVNEFISDAPVLQLVGNQSGGSFEVHVNDELVTKTGVVTPTGDRIGFDWNGVRRMRHYRVMFNVGSGLAAVMTGPAETVFAPAFTASPLLGYMADSYGQGGGSSAAGGIVTIPWVLARLMGYRLALSADGGTGYITRTGSAQNNALDRVPNFASRPVSAMLWAMGLNDPTEGLQAAAEACYAAFAAQHPGVPQFALGPWSPSSTIETEMAAKYAAIQAACAAQGVTFLDNRGWITGTGKSGTPTGNGNADIYIGGTDGTDGNHPTPEGMIYLGTRAAQAFASALVHRGA